MYNVGDRVTCEYFDDDEVFEIVHKRRVLEFSDDGKTVESDEFRYDIESDNEFDDDVPESVLHGYENDSPRFIDRKEYELRLGLIVKYIEELDELVSDDGFSIEAMCYDKNLKCDFCSEFDIVSPQNDNRERNKEDKKNHIGFGFGICCDDDCLENNKWKDFTITFDGNSEIKLGDLIKDRRI
jgi:hypothetical protein